MMLKVRVSKVTSDYLRDVLRVEPGVWYDCNGGGKTYATVKFPGSEITDEYPDGSFIYLGGVCAHLMDNKQTEWEVSHD